MNNKSRIFLYLWAPFAAAVVLLLLGSTVAAGLAAPAANAQTAPPSSTPGSVSGTITVGPELNSRKMRVRLYPDLTIARPAASPGYEAEIGNVVIYLEGTEAGRPAPTGNPGTLRMEQRDGAFIPHVLPVVRGASVEFPNSDPVFHNVFSLSRPASFDLGRYPRGDSRSVRFDRPGVVKVFCHIHSDMSAVILVLDNPHFAIPGSSGEYRLAGILPGSYTAVAWHERARPIRRPLEIRPGEASRIDFAIPLQEASVDR